MLFDRIVLAALLDNSL